LYCRFSGYIIIRLSLRGNYQGTIIEAGITFTSVFLEKPGFWMMKNPVSWPSVQGYAHTPLSTMSWVKRQTIYMACNVPRKF
jgi:hypothetical protein